MFSAVSVVGQFTLSTQCVLECADRQLAFKICWNLLKKVPLMHIAMYCCTVYL